MTFEDLFTNGETSGNWSIYKDSQNLWLKEGEDVWMSNTAWEMWTHTEFIAEASGDVLIAGLGLGYDVWSIKDKPEVTSIDVVEPEQDVINLCWSKVDNVKTSLIVDRILNHMQTTNKKYDHIFFDIFPREPTDYPDETQTLKDASNLILKPNGKYMFWKGVPKVTL